MHKLLTLTWISLGAICLAPPAMAAGEAATAGATVAPKADSRCPTLLRHTFLRLQDEKPQVLCQYSGKVLLVVNTASYCGFTPQYKGLEALYMKFKDKGLVVLGFPSNDFSQESGSNQQIADFCESTFGVKFPMFSKSSVVGAQANAMFRQLAQATKSPPTWNFHKYVIARNGQDVKPFPSDLSPEDPRLVREIERLLLAN